MFVATDKGSKPSTSTSTSTSSSSTSTSSVQWSKLFRQFKFSEILSATENFNESLVIGRGGSAKVYKGIIKNGSILVPVAIKRLNCMPNQGESDFWAEVKMLSKLRHCHLVSLIGYCNHQREMILVYEYMSNGTLADHLHKLATPLTWCQRLKMCIGAARGLDYLHTGTGIEFGIIHRDVKSSNILLDESWEAKISDFGLFKISPRNQPSSYVSTLVKGTFGYMDPNYVDTGKVTRKSDVYAFGVVLLEVLCRKRAHDGCPDFGLATWAQDSIKKGHLKHIVDPHIRNEISQKCLKQYTQLVVRCLNNHPKQRPNMAEMVHGLGNILTLQENDNNLLQNTRKLTIFGRMIDKLFIRDFAQNSGMEYITKGEKANPLKIVEGIQTVRHGQEYPQVITVVLKVRLHCEDCAKKIRKCILRMKGVESVEGDLANSQITVKGTFKEARLVDYVKERTRRAVVVKQNPEPKKDDDKGEEDAKHGANELKEEKKVGDGGGGKVKEKETDNEEEKQDVSSGDDMKPVNLRKVDYQYSQVIAGQQLVDSVHKRTGKKVIVVKQDPDSEKEDKSREDKKDSFIEKKEEKQDEAVVGGKGKENEKDEEKQDHENKGNQNEDKVKEKESDDEIDEDNDGSDECQRLQFVSDGNYHVYNPQGYQNYPPTYTMESAYGYTPTPQSEGDIKDVKPYMNEPKFYHYVFNPPSYQIYRPTYTTGSACVYTPTQQILRPLTTCHIFQPTYTAGSATGYTPAPQIFQILNYQVYQPTYTAGSVNGYTTAPHMIHPATYQIYQPSFTAGSANGQAPVTQMNSDDDPNSCSVM